MPRAIWNGTISFGLVNVPIGLYSAIEEKQIRFHQMTKSGHRIRQKRVDEKTGREVDYDALVKGYEKSRGKVVLVEPEELEAAAPEQTCAIEIEDFVELADIDPIYYNTTYYVAPRAGAGADKAYMLLRDAMRKSGRAAIGRFVMRGGEQLLGRGDMLFLPPASSRVIRLHGPYISEQESARLASFLRKQGKPTYDETITVEEPKEEKGEVLDLVQALQASLDARTKGAKGRRPAKRTRRKAS